MFAAVGALVVIGLVWFALQAYPLGGAGQEVIVTVHPGDSMAVIAGQMHTAGVIGSPFAFRLDTLVFGAPLVRPGSYEIAQNSTFAHVKAIFGAEPNVQVVTVSAGLTLHEVALLVASAKGNTFANTFVQDASAAAATNAFHPNGSLEGLIGVGQYIVMPTDTPAMLLARMTSSFTAQASAVGLTPSTSLDGLDAYQLLIAASIVEKEGYIPLNMPKVARVIFNRLARGMRLQMDTTVLYYLGLDGGTVTHAMLETKTPYNTYLANGLTPTPICSVSTTALRAVLHAPLGQWLYFQLIDKNGNEAFVTTFSEQLANERLAASRGI